MRMSKSQASAAPRRARMIPNSLAPVVQMHLHAIAVELDPVNPALA
jgi:hypothetical protein